MEISKNSVVKMHYSVMDSEETLIDSSYDHNPLEVIQGTGFLIPGLDDELVGKNAGDKFTVSVPADKAYGERFEEYVQSVPKDVLAGIDDLQVGMQLRATTDDGEQTVIVIDIQDDAIVVDGNHPLAGVDLTFDVEILEVRAATEEELAHGHVHSGDSCCGSEAKDNDCCS